MLTFIYRYSGGRHSTEVAFALLTQPSGCWYKSKSNPKSLLWEPAVPKNLFGVCALRVRTKNLKILIFTLSDGHSLQSRHISKLLHWHFRLFLTDLSLVQNSALKKARSFFSPAINSIMTVCSITDRSNVTADGSCQLSLPTMQVGIGKPIIASRVSVFQARVLFLPGL